MSTKTLRHQERRRSVPISARRIRSLSLTMPTRRPSTPTTGTALILLPAKILATSLTGVAVETQTTSRVMTSATVMGCADLPLVWDVSSGAAAGCRASCISPLRSAP
jgi:hypothetical protein